MLTDKPFVTHEDNDRYLYDDFINIGRGLDISNLGEVVVVIPCHYLLDIFGFGKSEFLQVIGRVGRFGNIGNIKIVYI